MAVDGLTHGEVIEQLVLNRLNDPCPLVHVEDWAEHQGILELCHIRPEQLNDDRLGGALDAIEPYGDDIEEAIVLHALSRFSKIDTSQVLWDTTSFYFEGDHDESDLIRYGYNRDQKKDKKQAVVELNVTAKGGNSRLSPHPPGQRLRSERGLEESGDTEETPQKQGSFDHRRPGAVHQSQPGRIDQQKDRLRGAARFQRKGVHPELSR